ncbi:MAG TPA: DNA cytosine methyltransferase [Alphaproteobacteria bacterium]|nr:DNA cytosine methyltransferase [Alphaproteobacteria bacterium]
MRGIELFAGAGGLGIGLSIAGIQPLRVVEWDNWCCDTIRENRRRRVFPVNHWPEPIQGDVRQQSFSDLEGRVDVVSGGPPCQPFSLGGKHMGRRDDRDMWPEAVRVVRESKPRAFIFENVKGLTRDAFASYLSYIYHQLSFPEILIRADESWTEHLTRLEREKTAGAKQLVSYRVVYRVLNAADFGVPQRRERIVFVGFRSDQDVEWSFPNPSHSLDALLWSQCRAEDYWERHAVGRRARVISDRLRIRGEQLLVSPMTLPWRTVRDAIHDLPDPVRQPDEAARYHNHRYQAGARSYHGHSGSPLDEPAKTLKAGVHGVPGGENMLCRPDGSVRYFTVRESARLQTFPDKYRFHGSWTETMRQLGNAVPVELASTIAIDVTEHLLRSVKPGTNGARRATRH